MSHSGARSEPGISRFRVWSFGPSRNDQETVFDLEGDMKRFNLSGWAVSHPALILFLMIALGVAGFFSYQKLGRAEDPFFTVKVVNVSVIWPGATAAEMQSQVADPIEKKLQELPYFEKVQTYSKPTCRASFRPICSAPSSMTSSAMSIRSSI